jgi:DNA-binding PadR family transcriptional regulator
MLEQELVLLGLLKEGPKHGYQIKKEIKEILSLFAGLDLKSIYYPLRVLEKRGLVIKRIARSGRYPLRYVYELTARGQGRFATLLNESLLDFKRPQFSLDLSLYFLNYIKPDIAKRRLRARMLILRNLLSDLKQMVNSLRGKKSPSLIRILEHNLQMVESEYNFLLRLIKTLSS